MDLNEDYIPYEESLALRELGFAEKCFFAFDNCLMRCTDLRTPQQQFEGVNYNSSSYVSQPSYRQAFRWFKEKHGLWCVAVMSGIREGEYYYHRFDLRNENRESEPELVDRFSTSEEAELAGLQQMIDMVKQAESVNK
jgi:hypothetical protein